MNILAEGRKYWTRRSTSTGRTRRGDKNNEYGNNVQLNLLQVGTILVASASIGYMVGKSNIISKKWKEFSENQLNIYKNSSILNNSRENLLGDPNFFRIVCFGDSTTWGYCPDTQQRLTHTRWVKILENELNNNNNNNIKYEIIGEGLNGRTIDQIDETSDKYKNLNLSMNGTDQLLPILYSHKPIDLIIIMLGINDCKSRLNPTVTHISDAMENLLLMVKNGQFWRQKRVVTNNDNNNNINNNNELLTTTPRVLLLPPIYMRNITEQSSEWTFTELSLKISQQLPRAYYEISKKKEFNNFVTFADGNHLIETGSDSVHLNKDANIKFGKFLSPIVKKILIEKTLNNNNNNNNNYQRNGEKDMLHPTPGAGPTGIGHQERTRVN